jgi:CRISPR/Cas system CSM-associated protein Csm5 (group 7 of RAMP superfamily)
MQLAFTTLSPVHIGNGETLAPLEYVVYKDTFYKISQEDFLRFLKNQMPDKQKDFARWIGERFQEMRETRDNRALSDMENTINPFAFCEELGREAENTFLNYIRNKQNGIFQAPVLIDNFTRRKSDRSGSKSISLNQVREMIKNGSGVAYVPGSSIKGAFRTALFYHYLSHFKSWNEVENILEDQLKDRRNRKERFSQPLMQDVFFCQRQDYRGQLKKNDEKLDLLKVLHISDAHIEQANQQLELAKVNIYLVQRKKEGQSFVFSGEAQRQTSYAETIKAGSKVQCEIRLDMPFLLQLKRRIRPGSDGIAQNGQIQWIGVEKKSGTIIRHPAERINPRQSRRAGKKSHPIPPQNRQRLQP